MGRLCMEICSLNRDTEDLQMWGGDTTEEFSVRLAYECLANHGLGHPCGIFNQLWQVKTFRNVLTSTWRIFFDKMPTHCSLIRRGVIVSSTTCEMYKVSEETSRHLFLECLFA